MSEYLEVERVDELRVIDAPKEVTITLDALLDASRRYIWVGVADQLEIGTKNPATYRVIEWVPGQGLRCERVGEWTRTSQQIVEER